MGRYLCALDWPPFFNSLESCEELLNTFQQVISTGLDLLMPLRKIHAIIIREVKFDVYGKRQTANGKRQTFTVCLQLSVQQNQKNICICSE